MKPLISGMEWANTVLLDPEPVRTPTPGQVIRELIPEVRKFGQECPGDFSDLDPLRHGGYSEVSRHKVIPHLDLVACIVHLNDHHKWSREKIADWLDTLDLDLRFPSDKVG